MSTKPIPDNSSNERDDSDAASPDWSQFSQRLASFGLGETGDPLTTRTPALNPPNPRRRGNGGPT